MAAIWGSGIPVSWGLGGKVPRRPSTAVGVDHIAARIADVKVSVAIRPSFFFWPPVCSESSARGVGHIDIAATVARDSPVALRSTLAKSGPAAAAFGVGHKEYPVSAMGSADTASWQNCRRAGVCFRFQVIEGIVKPSSGNRVINLLAKDFCRAALADEPTPIRP